MIAYLTSLYEEVGHSTVFYDDLWVNEGLKDHDGRKEQTRLTKNIGLVAGLRRLNSSTGFIIATTHLFWHPRYASF